MNIEIKHRRTGAVLVSKEAVRDLVEEEAVVGGPLRDADLEGAHLRNADLGGAYLRDADLRDANLNGADLTNADLRDADLNGADLNGAYLRDADLGGAYLRDADLGGADLSDAYLRDADLRGADLRGADLRDADLGGAYLDGAYLRGVKWFLDHKDPEIPYKRKPTRTPAQRVAEYRALHPEVPVVPQLDAKILAILESGEGKLDMDSWHSCETTHCRAGWAIHLAGTAGYALEKELEEDSAKAGRAIYLASTGRSPHFYATKERALEDIRRCAEEDAARIDVK
jgi:hypothetical protein